MTLATAKKAKPTTKAKSASKAKSAKVAKAVKPKAAKKPAAKPKAKAPAKKPVTKKPVAKKTAKPVSKKPVAKKAVAKKVVAKKPAAKVATKATTKAVAKAVPKSKSAAVSKAKPKPVTKASPKTVAKVPASKVAAKPEPVQKAKPSAAKPLPVPLNVSSKSKVKTPQAAPAVIPGATLMANKSGKTGRAGAVQAAPVIPAESRLPIGKGGVKATLVAAAPAAPTVVIPAPVRALPKSLTVKAAQSNVLPFNPKTTRVAGLLSEAEILKQSKDDYMSKAQLAFFKQRLQELASQLRENAGQTTEHLRELAIVPDPADRATLEEEHALELRARDRERKLLKKVESALLRIDDGSYGYCEETGDPIGVPRLLARPTATLSIEAQERREMKQKMFGE